MYQWRANARIENLNLCILRMHEENFLLEAVHMQMTVTVIGIDIAIYVFSNELLYQI